MKMRLLIKYFFVGFLFLLFHFSAHCQPNKQGNVWIFGERGCMQLDFNNGAPVPTALPYIGSPSSGWNIANYYSGSSASVCDANGQLLFRTDGSYVGDRTNNFMLNGTDLTGLYYPGGFDWDSDVTSPTNQGALIVPMPDSANKYYVFSLTENVGGAESSGPVGGRLFYSVVDMDLNGGLGGVVPGRKGIVLDSNLSECMSGVVGDGCNVWVMVQSKYLSQFRAYEITSSGINTMSTVSPTGGAAINNSYTDSRICFSPNRKKMAIGHSYYAGMVELYDFDAATGALSNRIVLDSESNHLFYDKHYQSVCFSPDNSKLYASKNEDITPNDPPGGDDSLWQFDLSSGDPATMMNSRNYIGVCKPATDIKLAPDGKVYFISRSDYENPDSAYNSYGVLIGALNQPNLYGAACQYVYNAIPSTASLFPLNSYNDTGVYYNCFLCSLPNAVPVFHRDTTHSTQKLSTPCFATIYTINANDSGWDYHWENDTSVQTYISVDSTGTYIVHYFTAPCMYHTDTFLVYFSSPAPSTGALSGCPGQKNGKAWVQPHLGDITTYTYTWTDAFGNILQPATTSSIIADTLYNQYAGTYTVTLQGINGCDTFFSVIISPSNDSGFLRASDTGMCPHDTITIYVTGGVSYHWRPNNKTFISDTSIADPKVSPQTDWSYFVYGSNTSGCLDTATAHVRVFPDPVIRLPDSVILYYGESYQFNPGTNCLTFSWFPPLGLNADNISNPIASPPVDTKYIVTGTTEEGCMIKDSVNVYLSSEVVLTLPNAFTPGNGPNNVLKPIHEGDVALDYLRVFNRWGQMVYESSDLNQGWDGTWHGTPQPEGVYVYMMEGRTAAGRIISKQGNVTLLR